MTFVLSALTQHEVIQVSDRRFTYVNREPTDEDNKAVLFCGRLLFSFTGVGDLGMERQTDLWLAQRICDVIAEADRHGQDVLLEGIRAKATEQFRKLRYKGRCHAFIGVGWARFVTQPTEAPAQPDEFTPYLALISNFHRDGRALSKAETEFSTWFRLLEPGQGFVLDVPNHLAPAEMDSLVAGLAAADTARDPDALVGLVAEQIRAVAGREDAVGEGLMINRVPRASLGNLGMLALAGGPMTDAQTFLYVPPSGDTTVQLGPVTTCGAGITSGFRAEPPPPGLVIPRPGPTLPEDPPGLVRRWYLVPVVGSGTQDDPYQAETHGQGGSSVMPSGEEGHPKQDVALILVSSQDHGPLESDDRIHPIADLADLDRPVSKLDEVKRAWIKAVAQHRQVSAGGSAREVLRRLGEQLQEGFDETNYWVK